MKNNNIFFDMDGVLAVYHPDTPTLMYNKDFFLNRPVDNLALSLIKTLIKENKHNIYILSKAITEQCKREKYIWLERFLPELSKENIFILDMEDSKSKHIKSKLKGKLENADNYLIDDLTSNLEDWESTGDNYKPIKYFNQLNSRNWKSTGKLFIDYEDPLEVSLSLLRQL